ncbi:MAG TPA: DUF327 family protein [Firmicutes bacterium]|nr:DUF327 family protein [Bacillota bacterium]
MSDPIEKIRNRAKRMTAPIGNGSVKPEEVSSSPEIGFRQVLQGIAKGPAEQRLGKLLDEIHNLAGLLARRKLLEDLDNFREKVGEFLRTYLDEVLVVREAAGSSRGLRKKQMVVVKKVNVELEELSRLVLGGEPDFKILMELETIEGLLMDLYR